MGKTGKVIRGRWQEEPRAWIVFGERPDGLVDVSDGEETVMLSVPRDVAEEAIHGRQRAIESWWAWASSQPREDSYYTQQFAEGTHHG